MYPSDSAIFRVLNAHIFLKLTRVSFYSPLDLYAEAEKPSTLHVVNPCVQAWMNRTALRLPQGEQSGLGVLIIPGQTDRLVVFGHQIGKRLALEPWAGKWAQFGEVLAGRPNVALWYATTVCRHQKCSTELAALNSQPAPVLGWVTATALY